MAAGRKSCPTFLIRVAANSQQCIKTELEIYRYFQTIVLKRTKGSTDSHPSPRGKSRDCYWQYTIMSDVLHATRSEKEVFLSKVYGRPGECSFL